MKHLAFIFVAVTALGTARVEAGISAWSDGVKASVRLLAAGIDGGGRLSAGIEIVMPQGWHTYWRSPGDAGIAPLIDFSGSKNLGKVEIAYPAPTRLDDGYSVTNIYLDRVVLPFSAMVEDRTKPVDLGVTLDIGVCREVCVPDRIEVTLTGQAGEADEDAVNALADAWAAVPGAPEPGVFAITTATRDGGTDKRPVFRIAGVVPDAGKAEVFVEGPPDWSAYVPETAGVGAWTVTFSRLAATTPIPGAEIRLTIVSGGRAIEQAMTLK